MRNYEISPGRHAIPENAHAVIRIIAVGKKVKHRHEKHGNGPTEIYNPEQRITRHYRLRITDIAVERDNTSVIVSEKCPVVHRDYRIVVHIHDAGIWDN